jgi:hypothetical protein
MDSSVETPSFAWQPLTPRGVAAFARAPLGRLLAVQLAVALLAAATVVWFLHQAWFPAIRRAINQLPEQGEIRAGNLDWRGHSPARLSEERFLSITVDLKHEGQARSPAQIQVELGQSDCQIYSLLGFVQFAYPREWVVGFNRQELIPWWGAWAPPILAMVAGGVIVGLLLSWTLLATVYCLPVWLIGFFANRDLSLRGSWRLAGAALLPGALLLTAAIFLYGSGAFDLIRLAVAGAAHLVIGWVYLVASPLRSPPHPAAAVLKQNPFVPPARGQAQASGDGLKPPESRPPGTGQSGES